jgi:hypothetical protein
MSDAAALADRDEHYALYPRLGSAWRERDGRRRLVRVHALQEVDGRPDLGMVLPRDAPRAHPFDWMPLTSFLRTYEPVEAS